MSTPSLENAKLFQKTAAALVAHARHLAEYWATQPNLSVQERTEGVAFSMLVALDGEALAVGPFALRPINRNGKEGKDIAGGLHDRFFQKPKKAKAVEPIRANSKPEAVAVV